MKSRDRAAVSALRATLAAIDNAEAVVVDDGVRRSLAIEDTPVGAGAAEAERRVLTEEDVERIIQTEVAERETAAVEYEKAGHADRAAQLRAEAHVLTSNVLDGGP
jgi:uncharacterized protein YqeY